ncbi:MAG TPA: AsmA family protein [Terriglobales bacterium]|nr:AsmA family protein [Terriglobales bacterium]
MRKILIAVAVVVGLLVIALIAVAVLVDANTFRPQIEAKLQQALGRKVTIGNIKFSPLSGALRADNITIADDPAFSNSPFIRAKSLQVGVEMGPLIQSRELRITSLTLVEPDVNLLQSADGKWNFSSIGKTAGTQAAPSSKAGTQTKQPQGPAPPASREAFSVEALKIQNGRVTVGRAGSKPHSYSDVDLDAKGLAPGAAIPFTLTATAPGGGKVKLEGKAGPLDSQDAAMTPLQAALNISDLNLTSSGFFPPDSGISGILDYSGNLNSENGNLHSQGTVKTQKLRMVKNGSPTNLPVSLDYAANYDMRRLGGVIQKGDVHAGNLLAHVTGTYDARGTSTVLNMNFNGRAMPMQDIANLLPAFGVTLPAGSSLQGGTVTTNLNLTGPVDRLVTTGRIEMNNAKLSGFSMGSQLATVAQFAGVQKSNDTTIQTMSANLRIAPDGTKADNINLIVAELGAVTGAGTVSPTDNLNFHMVAKLNTAAGSTLGGLASLAGASGKTPDTLPFRIAGTTSRPEFIPDVGSLVGSTLSQQLSQRLSQGQGTQQQNQQQDAVQGLVQGLLGGGKKKGR